MTFRVEVYAVMEQVRPAVPLTPQQQQQQQQAASRKPQQLAVARFAQEKGAASSFHKVVQEVERVLRDKKVKVPGGGAEAEAEMVKVLVDRDTDDRADGAKGKGKAGGASRWKAMEEVLP